jgi:hypothetical protein
VISVRVSQLQLLQFNGATLQPFSEVFEGD